MTHSATSIPDWDFHDEDFSTHLTSIHPYPARFPPALPRQAMDKLVPGSVVLDPFAGCGTTLVEAQRLGHRAVGIDVNHLANLLQRCYTTTMSPAAISDIDRFIVRCQRAPPFIEADSVLAARTGIPRLEHWFSRGAISAIGTYLQMVESTVQAADAATDILKLSLSRVLVRISRQESDTQYRAVKPDLDTPKAWSEIIQSVIHVRGKLVPYLARPGRPSATCLVGDSREPTTFRDMPRVDLVVTSPPYPNSYEYWLYHKYRMFWLDLDPIWSRTREIGARPYYSGSGKLGADDFKKDMRSVLSNLSTVTADRARQVWVVGDSIIKGELVDNANLVVDAAAAEGWQLENVIERNVKRARSSFQGFGRLKTEKILFFQRV